MTTAIITDANELMAPIDHRMPAILAKEDWPGWLGEVPAASETLLPLLRPFQADRMKAWKVGAAVGNVRNQGALLLKPLPA